MQTAILKSDSDEDLKLLIEIAQMGIKARLISDKEMEDIGLANAIKKGRTGQRVDTDSFLNKLRK